MEVDVVVAVSVVVVVVVLGMSERAKETGTNNPKCITVLVL
jgi:hypothetical protein